MGNVAKKKYIEKRKTLKISCKQLFFNWHDHRSIIEVVQTKVERNAQSDQWYTLEQCDL